MKQNTIILLLAVVGICVCGGIWLCQGKQVQPAEAIVSEGTNDSLTQQTAESEDGLNTAAKEQLMTLTGIGEAKAIAIIAYREEKGKFQKPEDLMNIPGIKEGVFDKIKSRICV